MPRRQIRCPQGRSDKPRGAGRWGLAVVRGRSMEPGLRDGDRLLVRYAAVVRPGSRVLVRMPDGTLAVKRAAERRATRTGADGWWVLSDNPDEGVDSRHRGVLDEEAVRAVVRLRVWPPGRR
ncbi:S24/S26 family peptidase [Nocardioides donggukensis]|uniref:S24/S26 family peptidase n=1 Tax=Nocardioides donggukensis TaxID=2774019 RepID=UPI00191D8899|nr:S24/S26 family peptidase [Nocardioides donggukensis]